MLVIDMRCDLRLERLRFVRFSSRALNGAAECDVAQNKHEDGCSWLLAFFQQFVLMNEPLLVLGSCVTKAASSELGLDDLSCFTFLHKYW